MTIEEMSIWIQNSHKEVLTYIKQEFDGEINGFNYLSTPNMLGDRYYSIVDVSFTDGSSTRSEMVTKFSDGHVHIEKLTYQNSNLPEGF